MTLKNVAGFIIAFAVGALCRLLLIPNPSPTEIIGGVIVIAMSLGYVSMDSYVKRNKAPHV